VGFLRTDLSRGFREVDWCSPPSLWVIPKIKLGFLDFFEPFGNKLYLLRVRDESDTMILFHVTNCKATTQARKSPREK